ncbi:ComEA family DNA-binding protein [Arthrobacter sp. NPDC080086]|uniref:ComEA family DNA-binding protein n=1 Tax=Arthrobacter sp. NPDC080086 TaxID=3155917 RepID=UPI0034508592
MPRRSPTSTLPGPLAARHRWAASLGPSGNTSAEGSADDAPLLDPLDSSPDARPDDGVPEFAPPVVRWRTARGAAVLLAVVAVLLGGWFWWRAAGSAPQVVPLSERSTTAAAVETAPAAPAERVVVHVTGAVIRPGVLTLPAGSRLHEAIAAAGGATPTADLDRLNLAAAVEDGQKIVVPERGSPEAQDSQGGASGEGGGSSGGSGSGSGASGNGTAKVNLNTADAEELATLPRVGPVLAQRIVDWRKQHGRFTRVEELDAVDGVGPKLLEALLPLVRV